MAPTDPDGRIGSVLDGRYRILERLSEGSMGVVYRGERMPVGKPVAVKFLHALFASDPEFLNRFERETRVMSKLAHPHCVSVLDFGVAGGAPYMVMDFVTGVTLRHVLDDAPLPVAESLGLMRQLLAGLAHAHAQGIVHRDVKPANIMVSEEIGTGRHVRILDFGLARLRGSAATSTTQSGIVVGTPNYMAPEQTVGGEVDARTDLYAAGVVLFEMLTGQRPFAAQDTLELFQMHRGAPVPKLREVVPELDLPTALDGVLKKALAKKPADRFASAVDFAAALDEIAIKVDPAGAARRASTMGVRPPTMAPDDVVPVRGSGRTIAVLLLLAVGGATAWAILRDHSTPPVAGQRVGLPDAGPPGKAAPTPDRGEPPPATKPTTPTVAAPDAGAMATIDDLAGLPPKPAPPIDPTPLPTAPETVAPDAATAEPPPAVPAVPPPPAVVDAGAAPETAPAAPPVPEDEVPDVGNQPDTESEAPDAPKTTADAEAREAAKPAPAPARTVQQALAMLKAGKREQALAGLNALWKKSPRSANLPYLIGNIYFDKQWWSVAMAHYRAAIARSPAYKRNGTLIRNVIHCLNSRKTRGQASWLLRKVIGRPARPYLAVAARRDPSGVVRSSAAWLLKRIR